MDGILRDAEKMIVSNLEQIEKTKLLFSEALQAVQKAKESVKLLPPIKSKKELMTYLFQNIEMSKVSNSPEETKKPDDKTLPIKNQMSSVPKDITVQVTVTSLLDNEAMFWCAPINQRKVGMKQRDISNQIRNSAVSYDTKLNAGSIVAGQMMAVYVKEKRLWLRAIVEKELSCNQVSVRCVDNGKNEKLAKNKLHVLPEKLAKLPYLAYQCKLFTQGTDQLPRQAKWKFADLTQKSKCILKFKEEQLMRLQPMDQFKITIKDSNIDIHHEVQKIVKEYTAAKEDAFLKKPIKSQPGIIVSAKEEATDLEHNIELRCHEKHEKKEEEIAKQNLEQSNVTSECEAPKQRGKAVMWGDMEDQVIDWKVKMDLLGFAMEEDWNKGEEGIPLIRTEADHEDNEAGKPNSDFNMETENECLMIPVSCHELTQDQMPVFQTPKINIQVTREEDGGEELRREL